MKTNGKRNRTAGHRWERDIVNELKKRGIYPHVVTTRLESQSLDNRGIDVMNHDEFNNGLMDDTIQAKTFNTAVPYPALMTHLKQAKRPHPAIFHRFTGKSTGGKFMVKGRYVISDMDTYLEGMAARQAIKRIRVAGLSPQDMQLVENILKKLSL